MKTESIFYEGPPIGRHDSPSASVVQIDAGKLMQVLPWFVMAAVLAIIALISVGLVYKDLWDKFTMSENETKLLEMYVMQVDAKLVAQGVLKVGDTWAAARPKMDSQLVENQ